MQSRYMLKLRAKQILVSVKPSPLFAGMMLTAISFLIYIFQYSGSGNTYAELINSGVRDITKLSEALVSDLAGNPGALVLRLVFSLLNTYISFGLVCYSFRLSSGETAVPLQEIVNAVKRPGLDPRISASGNNQPGIMSRIETCDENPVLVGLDQK